jgi:hypothetical protein
MTTLTARFSFAVDEAGGYTEGDDGEKVDGDDSPDARCHKMVLLWFFEGWLCTR